MKQLCLNSVWDYMHFKIGLHRPIMDFRSGQIIRPPRKFFRIQWVNFLIQVSTVNFTE